MKRVKVYVPVILNVMSGLIGDDVVKLELTNESASDELDIIETDAINAYESGDFQQLEDGE